ncbi:MAG: bromoperoxidase [Pseudomonadota bacterium]
MPEDRAESAYRFRVEAATKARHRAHTEHHANPDEARYGAACYPMSFTKGLAHDKHTGLVAKTSDFEAFRTAIDNGFAAPFTTDVPVPPASEEHRRRLWEAPTAGLVHELQGPDPQAVTMPPAPELGSDELTYEMAEVYELALLRDEPFKNFDKGSVSQPISDAICRLDALPFAKADFPGTRGRITGAPKKHDRQTLFRGSSPGVDKGPYLSQFLLIGTRDRTADGLIDFGAQTIDQRVLQASVGDDYMAEWNAWLKVQNGYEPRDPGTLGQDILPDGGGLKRRLICTPRDLATYVHVDALYQAYLNACLILLGQNAPFDPSFDLQSGLIGEIMTNATPKQFTPVNAGGFALYGGPHILSLVTEVATRGLKAVRFQKFNVHLRLRPEALAARVARAGEIEGRYPTICGRLNGMSHDLGDGMAALLEGKEGAPDQASTLAAVIHHNQNLANGNGSDEALLPMAFEEGSPMHPTYGAGHATVAGACVTMLKAFFDTSAVFVVVSKDKNAPKRGHFWNKDQIIAELKGSDGKSTVHAGAFVPHCEEAGDTKLHFEAYGEFKCDKHGKLHYHPKKEHCPLTLEGELNKLCANISIGRNMAGVHYYSDYYDSARMGEEITIGILEEQALGYITDPFVMSLPTFDGNSVRIGRR